jgi:hypothetical protein
LFLESKEGHQRTKTLREEGSITGEITSGKHPRDVTKNEQIPPLRMGNFCKRKSFLGTENKDSLYLLGGLQPVCERSLRQKTPRIILYWIV